MEQGNRPSSNQQNVHDHGSDHFGRHLGRRFWGRFSNGISK